MHRILAGLIGLPLFASIAFAQEPMPLTAPLSLAAPLCEAALKLKCLCAVQLQSETPGLAKVTKVEGNVYVARDAGFTSAGTGPDLTAGDRLLTGEGSRAELLIAQRCALPVAAQSMVSLSEVEGCSCATLTSLKGEAGAHPVVAEEDRRDKDGNVIFWTLLGLIPPAAGLVQVLGRDEPSSR